MGLKIDRHFTRDSSDVFNSAKWENFTFEGRTIETPAHWSENAREILCRQYLRKNETSIRQVIARVASTIRKAGEWQKYFADSGAAQTFEFELTHILLFQIGSLNSPVWFNLGIFPAYGTMGRSQNYVWDGAPITSAYVRPQVSACFIQSIGDNLMSIFDLVKSEAKLFKFGSGSGTNFSNLRGKDEALEQGGTSSGLLSYLEVFDRAAQAIKSGGTTRRAAKMVCVDADHPEIEDFVNWKMVEERKARILSAAGFGTGMDSEAYRSVSGQNSNNSVRVTDDFISRVKNKQKWQLKERVSGNVAAEVDAATLFKQIARAAWECADPALQFHDTINKWHTCPAGGAIRASNPCSEYMFLDDSACNLASLNLVKFLKGKTIDWCGFTQAARILFIAQDILVDYASYPTEKIAQNSHAYRPLGLGYANLGGLLMRMGIPYDSEEGAKVCAQVTAGLQAVAFSTSVSLSEEFGSFQEYANNRESVHKVMSMHTQAWQELADSSTEWISKSFQDSLTRMEKSGIRNAQLTLLAPTGTIGLIMDCDTLGIEPEFSLVKRKTLAGGGELKLINQSVGPALENLGYNKEQVPKILAYVQANNSLSGAPFVDSKHYAVFDGAMPAAGLPDRRVSPFGHIRMVAAAQPFLSGAISKTVNLPTTFTVEDVEKMFLEAWAKGLKAISIYRDGSKSAQPLCVDC